MSAMGFAIENQVRTKTASEMDASMIEEGGEKSTEFKGSRGL